MNNFASYDNPLQVNTRGTLYIGNYGTEQRLFVPNFNLPLSTSPPNDPEDDNNHFQRAVVGRLTLASTVPGVASTTNVFDAAQSTREISVAAAHSSLADTERIQRVLNSPPVTPVKVEHLKTLLSDYDSELKTFLINGFSVGFKIGSVGHCHSFISPNLKSATENPQVIINKLGKEREAGRIVGPFSSPPFLNFVSSPLGVVPKKTPSEFRLIHHLSYPEGSSVNDSIPYETSSVHYARISDAIQVIKTTGAGCYMAKTDIKSAFRIVPIHPDDYHLLGMKWNDSYYFDRCLPMGCSSSCAIFEAFSTSLEWLSKHHLGASSVLHILDDFLFIAETEAKCRDDLNKFLLMCQHLGIPIAQEKTEGPETTLQFAGITLDSVIMEARLPEEKLLKCRTMLTALYKRRKVTLRELQSLLGLLNFTCSVVLPGRAFLRRLIDLTKGARRPHHRIRLTKAARLDILTWLTFLEEFNGRTFFLEERWLSSPPLTMYSDAAGSKGYGAIFGSKWFYGDWPDNWKSINITFLELFPIVIALHVWASFMANKCVHFFTDNAAVVEIINQQTSKHPLVMVLIRDLVLTSLKHNIMFRASHVPGVDNTRADLISRFQIQAFREIFPEADEAPTQVPENLLPRSWSLH